MSRIVSVHSFRGGTGKSNVTANLAVTLARRGERVGIVDTDIQSPGVHVLFGFDEDRVERSLNEYLWGECAIEEAAYDVSGVLTGHAPVAGGAVYLIPSSIRAGEIARVLREGYDVELLNEGFHALVERLELDVLLIDTHPGLNEETLLSIAISDALLVILRPDHQDYQGTAVTVGVARKLDVPNLLIAVNKALPELDVEQLRAEVGRTYGATVAGILPHSDDIIRLASGGLFTLARPGHRWTHVLYGIGDQLSA